MNYPDIQILNQRFGAPGRIAFRAGEAGLPIVSLINTHGACEVSLYGGHLLAYRPVGHSPVIFLSQKSEFEPGKPIRGGIPVCWPWFGPHPADPKKDKHGFARVMQWELDGTEYNGTSTVLRLSLRDSELSRQIWDHAFELKLTVTLDQYLHLSLTAENCDTKAFEMSQAFHPYFQVGDIAQTSVVGLDKAFYADRVTKETALQEGPLYIQGQVDRIYVPEKNEAAIRDGKLKRAILLTYSGTRNLVVWNPWSEVCRAIPDLGDEEYLKFVCVEPANVKDTAIELEPGARHMLSMTIQSQLI
jgi:glucose-6-phosphate 1-epimerase